MPGLGLSLGDLAVRRTGTAAAAPAVLTNAVIEGDSLTGGVNPGDNNGAYSFYVSAPAGKTLTVRAQGSRATGKLADLDTGNNTLMGHVTEDVTSYGGQLITVMIGTNDMSGGSDAAALRGDLALYWSKVKAAGGKLAVAPPPSMNSGQQYANYALFMGRRASYLATIRDPAVWGLLADYYFPMGEHPDLNAADNSVYFSTDGVHPTGPASLAGTGQAKLLEIYQPFIDTILDATRATSTTPYSSVWPSSETNLATGATITRRFVVAGVAHTGLDLGISVSGGGSPQVSLNGGAFGSSVGTGSGNGYRLYNGDVIDLKLTTSASNSTAVSVDLTIGGETRTIGYTTVAASTPVTATGAGSMGQNAATATINFPSIAVEAGTVVLALTGVSSGGGAINSTPSSITLTPTGGGTPITAALAHSGGRTGLPGRALGFYVATVATGGDYDVGGTRPAAATSNVLAWVTLLGADPTPASTVAFIDTANESDPHLTGSATVPANGIAIGALLKSAAGTGTTNAPTTLIADRTQNVGGNEFGLLMGYRTTAGALSFNNGFGTWARGAIVFKAVGT